MKLETKIYDKLKKVLPIEYDKIVLYANVTETAFDIHYYSLDEKTSDIRQCYDLAEEGTLDGSVLDEVFANLAKDIRQEERFQKDKINVVTMIITKTALVLEYQTIAPTTNLAKMKKEWKANYLK